MKKILIISVVVLIGVFVYLNYVVKKHDLRPLQKYEDITISTDTDCSSVKVGTFETDKSYIIRTEDRQTQTDKESGIIKEYFVNWKSDCEYILTSTSDKSEILRIKITAVNHDNYGCYIISDKHADNYPNFLSIKRIEK